MGVGVGGGMYIQGGAKYFEPQLPALAISMRTYVPKLHDNFTITTAFLYVSHKLKRGSDTALQNLEPVVVTANYLVSASVGFQFPIGHKWYIEPQIGGGYNIQSTAVTGGGTSAALNNGFPIARAGILTGFRVNTLIDLSLAAESVVYFDPGYLTFVPMLLGGVNLRF